MQQIIYLSRFLVCKHEEANFSVLQYEYVKELFKALHSYLPEGGMTPLVEVLNTRSKLSLKSCLLKRDTGRISSTFGRLVRV